MKFPKVRYYFKGHIYISLLTILHIANLLQIYINRYNKREF